MWMKGDFKKGRMIRSSILFLLIISIVACTRPGAFTETERAELIQEAKQMLDNYYSDIRKEGLKAEFSYLDNSKEFFWVPPGYSAPISYDSVATILNQNASLYSSIHNSFDTLTVIPLSKELVSYSGRLKSIMTDTSGTVSTYSMVETGILIKRKDGWKLLSGQTSMLTN